MTSGCKVLEKCKKCKCCKEDKAGLADKIEPHRPAERVVERQIVELARCCEPCKTCEEKESLDSANI